MANLVDIIAYLMKIYPENLSHEMSNARLTKMVYLSDWHSCINRGRQISDINWYFDNHGPFVWDVKEAAESRPDLFEIVEKPNMFGSKKREFHLRDRSYKTALIDAEKSSLDHIVDITKKLYWAEFIKLVYATYPVASSERYTNLDLVKGAKEYREGRKMVVQ